MTGDRPPGRRTRPEADAHDDNDDDDDQQQHHHHERPRQRLRLSKNKTTGAAAADANADANAASPARCRACGSSGHRSGFDPASGVYRDCPRMPCYLCRGTGHVARLCPHRAIVGASARSTAITAAAATALPVLLLESQLGRRGRSSAAARAAAATAAAGRAFWSAEGDGGDEGDDGDDEDEHRRPWRVSSACLDLHEGRVTCLAFPAPSSSSSSFLASGDRHGGVAIWNFGGQEDEGESENAQARSTYYPPGGIFRSLVNCLAFPAAEKGMATPGFGGALSGVGAAGDGTVRLFDLETGARRTLLELPNHNGNNSKVMVYWVAPAPALGCLLASDNRGRVHAIDARCGGGGGGGGPAAKASNKAAVVLSAQVHGRAAKVNAVAVADRGVGGGFLAATGCNDHSAQLLDLRRLSCSANNLPGPAASPSSSSFSSATLATLPHGGVVTHAAFCRGAGPGALSRGLVTTCHDNRLRVWDDVASGAVAASSPPAPSRAIVHSHNFSRHLPAFRAVPDPKFPAFAVVGRFLSEPAAVAGAAGEGAAAAAVHPVDVIDLTTGRLVAALSDPGLLLHVPTVNAAHPARDVVASGASRSVYVWGRVGGEGEEGEGRRSVRAAAPAAPTAKKGKGAA